MSQYLVEHPNETKRNKTKQNKTKHTIIGEIIIKMSSKRTYNKKRKVDDVIEEDDNDNDDGNVDKGNRPKPTTTTATTTSGSSSGSSSRKKMTKQEKTAARERARLAMMKTPPPPPKTTSSKNKMKSTSTTTTTSNATASNKKKKTPSQEKATMETPATKRRKLNHATTTRPSTTPAATAATTSTTKKTPLIATSSNTKKQNKKQAHERALSWFKQQQQQQQQPPSLPSQQPREDEDEDERMPLPPTTRTRTNTTTTTAAAAAAVAPMNNANATANNYNHNNNNNSGSTAAGTGAASFLGSFIMPKVDIGIVNDRKQPIVQNDDDQQDEEPHEEEPHEEEQVEDFNTFGGKFRTFVQQRHYLVAGGFVGLLFLVLLGCPYYQRHDGAIKYHNGILMLVGNSKNTPNWFWFGFGFGGRGSGSSHRDKKSKNSDIISLYETNHNNKCYQDSVTLGGMNPADLDVTIAVKSWSCSTSSSQISTGADRHHSTPMPLEPCPSGHVCYQGYIVGCYWPAFEMISVMTDEPECRLRHGPHILYEQLVTTVELQSIRYMCYVNRTAALNYTPPVSFLDQHVTEMSVDVLKMVHDDDDNNADNRNTATTATAAAAIVAADNDDVATTSNIPLYDFDTFFAAMYLTLESDEELQQSDFTLETMKHVNDKLDKLRFVDSTTKNNGDRTMVGLSPSYFAKVETTKLERSCRIRRSIMALLDSMFWMAWSLMGWMFHFIWYFVRYQTLLTTIMCTLAGGWYVLRARRTRQEEVSKQVKLVRVEALSELQASLNKAPGDGLKKGEVAVMHLRDALLFQLYEDETDVHRNDFITTIWPLVKDQIKKDNRVRKTSRLVAGTKREIWMWVAGANRESNNNIM